MRKQPGQYQLDFAVAASNARTIYRTAHISFNGWRDNGTEMFGEGGGLHIEITEISKGYASGMPQGRPVSRQRKSTTWPAVRGRCRHA
jgi:hypothetical protein